MPIVSRKEFAKMCGDDVKYLNVYINRGKVTKHDDKGKFVDSDNPLNAEFLGKRRSDNSLRSGYEEYNPSPEELKVSGTVKKQKEKGPKEKQKSAAVKPPKPVKEPVKVSKKEITIAESVIRERDRERVSQEMLRKSKDLELVQINIEKARLLLDKSAGKLLPIDLVTEVHKRYARSIFVNFQHACENIASKYCQIMAGGNPEMYTRIFEETMKELTRCIGQAGVESTEDIEQLIDEYSESRARGERKI